ncbi:MAG: hypothetical protein AAF797_10420 [Planctomycetota bacterium]
MFGLAAAPALSPALTPARADINITPGPANPDYPATEPDPWNVIGNLDLQGSDLSIDCGSVVNITGNLLTGDAFVLDSNGVPRLSLFLTQGTLNIGQSLITPTDDAFYFVDSDNSTLTAGANATIGSGGNATFLLNLANNALFDITAAGVFGADDSAVSISAADSAFRVGGAATFAGAGSGVLIFLENGSFDIGGDATFASGGNSSLDLIALDSDLNIGGTLTGTRGAGSASAIFLSGGQMMVGGDWLAGNAPASTGNSTSVITGIDTTIDVGGNFDAGLGPGSSNDLTWTGVTFIGGGDLVFGGTDNTADTSTASFVAEGSSITADGSFRSVLGSGSIGNYEFQNTAVNLGGDFLAEIGGTGPNAGGSTQTFNAQDAGFTANHLAIRTVGDNTSHSVSIADSQLNLAGDFLIETPGNDSDMLVFMEQVTGSVGGDFAIRGPGTESNANVVLIDLDLDIGNDLVFDLPASSTNSIIGNNLFVGELTARVGGDAVFDLNGVSASRNLTLAGLFDLEFVGDNTEHNLTLDDAVLAPAIGTTLDFRIATTGTGSSANIALNNLTGGVSGDLSVTGDRTILEFDNGQGTALDVGDDINFNLGTGSDSQVTLSGTTVTGGGDLRLIVGDESIQDASFSETSISLAGDLLVQAGEASGGSTIQAVTANNFELTANNAEFRLSGADSTSNYVWSENTVFDLTGDLTIENEGDNGNHRVLILDVSGDIDGSLTFRNSGKDLISAITLSLSGFNIGEDLRFDVSSSGEAAETSIRRIDLIATVGGDLVFDLPTGPGGDLDLAFGNNTIDVAGDLVFNLPVAPTGTRSVTWIENDVTVAGDVVIGEGTDFAASGPGNSADGSPGPLDASIIPTDIGGRLVVKGSLDLNDTFSRDAGLAVEDTGTITTTYATPGSGGAPNFTDASFTGAAQINGGTLAITQNDGPAPTAYQKSVVIAADGGATGAFDTITAPDFGDNTALAVTYESDGIFAQRALIGDATLNGGVSLKDYIIAANSQANGTAPATWTQGNFDGVGPVGLNDLGALADNFDLGPADSTDADSDLISLIVDLSTGVFSLFGDANLRAFSIASTGGLLDLSAEAGFDVDLAMDNDLLALGANGGGIDLDGEFLLSTGYLGDSLDGLEFTFGIAGDDNFYRGLIELAENAGSGGSTGGGDSGGDSGGSTGGGDTGGGSGGGSGGGPVDPNVIPTPTTAAAGLALLAALTTRRRRDA